MDANLKEMFKEIISDNYLKNKMKEVFTEKIIQTIKYDSSEFINETVKSLMDEGFKLSLKTQLLSHKEDLKKILQETIIEEIESIKKRIKLDISTWELEKLLKNNISVDKEKTS